jgi:curved DNA-binding protein CbpA
LAGVATAAALREVLAARRPATPPTPAPAPAASPATPLKRSDPAEARARRQKLLAQAMQNMGVGPFNRVAGDRPTATPPPGSTPLGEPHAPRPVVSNAAVATAEVQALRKALLAMVPLAKEKNFFTRLGLAETASRDEVKSAFLALARQFHPDLFSTPAMADLLPVVGDYFNAVNEAYRTLSDDKERAAHLASLRAGAVDPLRAEAARNDFQKGEACYRTRDFPRARAFIEAAVRADPRPEYLALLAQTWLADLPAKDVPKARQLIGQALARPGHERVHYVAGLVAREEGNDAEAERQFRAALAANPRHADALRELKAIEGRKAKGRR